MKEYPLDKIEVQISGTKNPPVLMLHGWGGDYQSFAVFTEPLSGQRKVISISLPGFGKSPEPSEPWGTDDYVKALKGWLERYDYQKLDIIAHSFGGRIAILMAASYPEMVNRLVLIDSAGLKPRRSVKTRLKLMTARNVGRVARIIDGRTAEYLNKWRDQLGSEDWKLASPVMRRILVRALEEDLSEELTRIHSPTLLLFGENDTATPLHMANKMADLIPDSKLEVIQDAGHFCYLEKKGEVLSKVWKHLELREAW